jgi:hypothetical protein
VNAIFVDTDVPANWKNFIELNAEKTRAAAG